MRYPIYGISFLLRNIWDSPYLTFWVILLKDLKWSENAIKELVNQLDLGYNEFGL